MLIELPKLPYEMNALEPVISQKTIEFHYGKHHQAYVNNLNNLIKDTAFEQENLEQIILSSEGGIFNNAAQVWNHTFYFFQFTPNGKGNPSAELLQEIQKQWNTLDNFKKEFNATAVSLFGSGWTWLVVNKERKLEIIKESNAGNPMIKGLKPILTFDVWEHAYYLDYQNRRPDYLNTLWNIINWEEINQRFNA
jgi:superoxide dismutase, Fe-Mn family